MARVAGNDMHQEQPLVRRPLGLIVRCFAERKAGQWQAFSLEFGLAAQADSSAEVQAKLMAMIESYVHEALTEDRAHAKALLARKGTLAVYAKFYWYRFLSFVDNARGTFAIYDEALALEPRICPT
jgi:hypothetical protein